MALPGESNDLRLMSYWGGATTGKVTSKMHKHKFQCARNKLNNRVQKKIMPQVILKTQHSSVKKAARIFKTTITKLSS
jgi:hypothetical protein